MKTKLLSLCLLLAFTVTFFASFTNAHASVSIPAITPPSEAVSAALPTATVTAAITLQQNVASIDGIGASWTDTGVLIQKSGTYLLSGTLENHSILVDTAEDEKITLLFNGVNIKSNAAPCLIVLSASKNVTVKCIENSVNLISCVLPFASDANEAYDAAIYSKEDLKFEGTGSMYITCTGGKGVNCRDDLSICDLSLYVIADDDGLRGKDSVVISSGNIHIQAGADGIRSNNSEDAGKGIITILDGTIYITAQLDGIQAENTLSIAGGNITLKTGSGAQATQAKAPNAPNAGRGGFPGGGWGGERQKKGYSAPQQQEDTISTKGIKSASGILISGGSIAADCQDDALHSDGTIEISGGSLQLSSGDDGIHAETSLTIRAGDVHILQSFEGIESALIHIAGGSIHLTASDDGINAAGGEKEQNTNPFGMGGRGFGGHGMLSSSSGTLQMSGGYVVVQGEGDGVDVNGDAEMTGGTLLIFGPESSGNGALDYDGTFSISHGTLLATGASGMAQSVTGAKDMQVLAFTCRIPANTIMHIENSLGASILTFVSEKSYSCVVFASDTLKTGEQYSIYAQGTHSEEPVDGIYPAGVYSDGVLLGSLTL